MFRFKERSQAKELIDLGPPYYSQEEYVDCLWKLGSIGKWLGGDNATLQALKAMFPDPISILDVGCGGGFLTAKIAEQNFNAKVVGIDTNPQAIRFADLLASSPPNVHYQLVKPALQKAPKSYDVLTANLLCHHMDEAELVDFLKTACLVAKRKVIINDLQRSFLAYVLFKAISPIFFRNRLIQHDGPLSIQRSFYKKDWERLLKLAQIKDYTISWRWAFRWLVEINLEQNDGI